MTKSEFQKCYVGFHIIPLDFLHTAQIAGKIVLFLPSSDRNEHNYYVGEALGAFLLLRVW